MAIRNLTPHAVQFFGKAQFVELEQLNPTTFVADGVEGDSILSLESEGCARIQTSTSDIGEVEGIPLSETSYGDATGLPNDVSDSDTLVVSLPTLSMSKSAGHPLASQMACPKGVVRQRGNTSVVLGAMGLSK